MEINDILDYLAETPDRIAEFYDTGIALENNKKALQYIDDYFSDKVRYKYYEITRYIADYIITAEEPETVEYIMYRLKQIIDYMKSEWEKYSDNKCECPIGICMNLDNDSCPNSTVIVEIYGKRYDCNEFKQLYRRVAKLYDHIKLEDIRLSSINNQYKETLHLQDKLDSVLKDNIKKQEDISKTIDRLSNKEKDLYLQVVAILGIFTSIVVAVFGVIGIISDSQVLYESIKSYGIEVAIFSFLTTAFMLYNIVLIIVQCVRNQYIKDSDSKANERMILAVVITDIVIGACIFICLLKVLL